MNKGTEVEIYHTWRAGRLHLPSPYLQDTEIYKYLIYFLKQSINLIIQNLYEGNALIKPT